MLERHKKRHDARMEQDKELYERQIRIVDAQIDRLVYDLYGLTVNITDIYWDQFLLGHNIPSQTIRNKS